MASGYLATGGRGDLDGLLMARVNAPRANTGLLAAGVDLAQRYEPIGAGTPIAPVGHLSQGVDVATLFRNINEALATHILVNLEASSGVYGYSLRPPSFGSLYPSSIYKGVTIQSIYNRPTGPANFVFEVAGLQPKNFFTQMVVQQNTTPTYITLLSSTATHQQQPGEVPPYTTWVWGLSVGWASAPLGTQRTVDIS